MNIGERIYYLRKLKGVSQEEVALQIGISRQAISKWESNQSVPDLEKVIVLSDYFNVTTDYILKGIDLADDSKGSAKEIQSKIMSLGSTCLMIIGLLVAFVMFYENQNYEDIGFAMIIQVVAVFFYFTSIYMSKIKPHYLITWLNLIVILVIPISMISSFVSVTIFYIGKIAPYPMGRVPTIIFAATYGLVVIASYRLLRKKVK